MEKIHKTPSPSSSAWPTADHGSHALSQTRLYFTAIKPASTAFFAKLEVEFDDDGLPIVIFEVDEEAGIEELSVYADDDQLADVEARIRQTLGDDAADLTIGYEALGDVDWVAKSLEGLQPVRAGRFFVYGSHDRDRLQDSDIGIEIEAGLAFGTGHHGTTSGCLEMIETVVAAEQPKNALDLGTGSAVLAIALAKLAKIPVLATDIDPIATDVAADNVALNGVSEHVVTATAEGFDDAVFAKYGPFDLIVANILAGPLTELAPQMATHLAKNGSLILSGILDKQHDGVVAAYQKAGFRHITTLLREEWVTIHLK